MEDIHFEPGLFALPLVINRGRYVSVQVEYKKSVLEEYLQKKLHRPERHAIRNLLGLLAARQEHYEEAMNYFTKVESEDSTNLNALANRKSLCEILYRFKEADECAHQIQMFQALSEEERKIGSVKEVDSRKREARCLAEQAYAYAFDIFDDSVGCERYLKSHHMYFKAMEMAGSYVDIQERQDWEFGDAVACRKIYVSKYMANEPYDSYFGYLDTSLWHFCRVTTSDDNDMKAESWRHIGEIINTMQSWSLSKLPPNCVRDNPELETYFNNPQRCITKALEITPRNPQLLTRLARIKRFTDSSESLRLLSQSIEIDKSRSNRFAFVVRGEIHLKAFQRQLKLYENTSQETNADPPDRNLLRLATDDIEAALSLNVSPKEYTNLACVWHCLAKDQNGCLTMDKQSKDCLSKAFIYHAKAINCENGALREDTNRERGICLFDAKEYDAAIESFKRAMECQSKTSTNPFTFLFLMKTYLTMISELKLEESGSTRLLSELAYWTEEAVIKYGGERLQTAQAARLWNDMPQEMNMFVSYCNSSGHRQVCEVFSQQHYIQRRFRHSSGGAIPRTSMSRSSYSQTFDRTQSIPAGSWRQRSRATHSSLSESSANEIRHTRYHNVEHQKVLDENTHGMGGAATSATSFGGRFHVLADEVEDSSSEGSDQESEPEALEAIESGEDTTSSMRGNEHDEEEQRVNPTDIKTDEILEPPEESRFPGHTYDFFAIYADAAGDWVHYRLLPMLERMQRLKGCIKERDFMPGRYVVENYNRCIEASASYLMVITEDFHQDKFCKYAMMQCLHPSESDPDQPRRVIPVLVEKCEMPKELAFKTHFDAKGVPNWDLLVEAIKECADAPVLE